VETSPGLSILHFFLVLKEVELEFGSLVNMLHWTLNLVLTPS
jgi:hypothetical protein